MTRFAPVRPYLTAIAGVEPGPWTILVGGEPQNAAEPLSGWDYSVKLEVSCEVGVQLSQVRDRCGLTDDAEVVVVATWHSWTTGVKGVGAVVPVTEDGELPLRFEVPSRRIAGEVVLSRQLVLAAEARGRDELAASAAGSILWNERAAECARIVLEGSASRFPTEVRDLAATVHHGAAWVLELALEDLNESPLNAIRLVVNEAHPFLGRLSPSAAPEVRRLSASVLEWDVGRGSRQRCTRQRRLRQPLGGGDRAGHRGVGAQRSARSLPPRLRPQRAALDP